MMGGAKYQLTDRLWIRGICQSTVPCLRFITKLTHGFFIKLQTPTFHDLVNYIKKKCKLGIKCVKICSLRKKEVEYV